MQSLKIEDIHRAKMPKDNDLLNDALYDLAEKYPKHKIAKQIYAKIIIIGRTYSAALDRGAGHEKYEGRFYSDKIVPAINNSNIDKLIDKARRIEKITADNLEIILGIHKALVDILYPLTGKNNRSFASKYLHFHCREAFFIYDSIAKKRISDLNQIIKYKYVQIMDEKIEKINDPEYKQYCLKCLALRDQIEENYGLILTPRQLDNLLLQKK